MEQGAPSPDPWSRVEKARKSLSTGTREPPITSYDLSADDDDCHLEVVLHREMCEPPR